MVLAMEQSPWKGPGGKGDSDRLYILCYDHTDWHCGRFSTEYIFGRHFYAGHQIPLMKYPRLKIGNQFGGGYYDWLATLDDTQNAFFFSSLQKLIKTYHCDIVGGTYSQPVSAFLPEETAIRQFTYGLEAIKKHTGVDVKCYAFSENTGWYYLPQILHDFGFTGSLLRSHYQPMGYPAEYTASLVNWTGPDGSKIDCVPGYKGDNLRVGQHGMSKSEAYFLDWCQLTDAEKEPQSTLLDNLNRYFDEKKSAGVDFVVMATVEDAHWGVQFDKLLPMLEEADPQGEKYRFVTLEEVVGLIRDSGYVPEDFDPRPNQWSFAHNAGYVGGLLTQWNAEIAYRLSAAETLAAFANQFCGENIQAQDAIDHAYKQHLNAEAHDGYEVPETTWTAVQQLLDASRTLKPILRQGVGSLCSHIAEHEDGVVLFNTLSFPRREPVTAEVPRRPGYALTALRAASGEAVPFDVLRTEEETVHIAFIGEIPAFGHAVYLLERAPGADACTLTDRPADTSVVETPYCRVSVEDGRLAGICGADGVPVLEGLDLSANYYHLEDETVEEFLRSEGRVFSVKEGATQIQIGIRGLLGGENFAIGLTLYRAHPAVDMDVSFTCENNIGIGTPLHSQGEAWGEANGNTRQRRMNLNLRPAFAVCADGGRRGEPDYPLYAPEAYNDQVNLTRYTPFYPEAFRRENDFNTLRSQPDIPDLHIYDVNSRYWADLSDKNSGLGMIMCTKGNAIMIYDGCDWSFVQLQASKYVPSVFQFSKDREEFLGKAIPAREYQWHYRLFIHGAPQSLTDYDVAGGKLDAHRAGVAFNQPLICVHNPHSSGTLPLRHSYLEGFDVEGTVSTMVTQRDGGLAVRLYEYQGKHHPLPAAPVSALSMDLSAPRPLAGDIAPYKIVTYRVEPAEVET